VDAVHSVAADPPLTPVGTARVLYYDMAVLGGELAVPCTRNPLQRDRTPTRGLTAQGPARARDEEDRVPRNEILPTPPGPEGSNGT